MNGRTQTLGQQIRESRVSRGLSQSALAKQIDCTQAHISLIESDKYLPSLPDAKKLAEVLGIDIAVFLEVA